MTVKPIGSSVKGHETHEGGGHRDSPAHGGNSGKDHHGMGTEHEKNIHSEHHGEHTTEDATHGSPHAPAVTHHRDKEGHSSGHQGEGHHPSVT
jgi:hypothetical protein